MSQRISPLLFNTYLYTNSKWFTQKNLKFSLNEDLQYAILFILFLNNQLYHNIYF